MSQTWRGMDVKKRARASACVRWLREDSAEIREILAKLPDEPHPCIDELLAANTLIEEHLVDRFEFRERADFQPSPQRSPLIPVETEAAYFERWLTTGVNA